MNNIKFQRLNKISRFLKGFRVQKWVFSQIFFVTFCLLGSHEAFSADWWKPYSAPCVEREDVFEFTQKPTVKLIGKDNYEITFAVKGYCDVTVDIIKAPKFAGDPPKIIRHLASGVLGSNVPEPFQKNSLKQTLYWDGRDDLRDYEAEPENLQVRVSLGLQPKFDKLLGDTNPKNLPGRVWGIAADKDGVYVFVMGAGRGHITVRKFDHDADYVATLWPPPGNLPESKLGGMGYMEYEPGKKSIQSPVIHYGMWRESHWMPRGVESKYGLFSARPAAAGGHIYFVNSGYPGKIPGPPKFQVKMHYINTDGSTEYEGLQGVPWQDSNQGSRFSSVAISPDNKTAYMVGLGSSAKQKGKVKGRGIPVLLAGALNQKTEQAKILVGAKKVGSDNSHFSSPIDVSCDPKGRIYVADTNNNRVQIFSPDGSCLKTIKINGPQLVQVHQKTGVIYIGHNVRVDGMSEMVISRFSAFPALKKTAQWGNFGNLDVMTLDSWSSKPRIWMSSESSKFDSYKRKMTVTGSGLRVFEDTGKNLTLLFNFDEEAKKEAGENYAGKWDGGMYQDIVCDPVREKLYYKRTQIYDLKTGKFDGWFGGKTPSDVLNSANRGKHGIDVRGAYLCEIAFDKRGYMHGHIGKGFACKKGVVRMDPDIPTGRGYKEVPYDYGEIRASHSDSEWLGVLPGVVTAAQSYTFGIGTNMQGDVVSGMRLMYAPKMGPKMFDELAASQKVRQSSGFFFGPNLKFGVWEKTLQEAEKRGESLYVIKREPGIPLKGAVLTTFDRSGELRERAAVVAGSRNNGSEIDEDGNLYFTHSRHGMKGGKPFLFNRGGNFGGEPIIPKNKYPFLGVQIKVPGQGAKFILRNATIPYDKLPSRPADLSTPPGGSLGGYPGKKEFDVWVNGAKWIYAGASPIVGDHCDCPQMHTWLDWHKRSFVPEAYRHSVGILDSNGNLILHVGQYGNFDSGAGKNSKVPLGGDGIATTLIRYVSGTDNYMCMMDWGQRIVVAKLTYNKQETVSLSQ